MRESTKHNLRNHFELNYWLYIGFFVLMTYVALTNDNSAQFGLSGYKHNFIVFGLLMIYIHYSQMLDSRNGFIEK